MAMFSGAPDASPGSESRVQVKEPGLSIIAAGSQVKGELETSGVVKVEGTIAGSVRAEGQVLVTTNGFIDGNVYTREAVIGGKVKGAVYADERVEVQATCVINGDIHTKRIVVQEGGEVNGHVQMGKPDALGKGKASPGPNDGKAQAKAKAAVSPL